MDEAVAARIESAEPGPASAEVEEASSEFLGRWNRLISTTNWEKGRIICQWRMRLMEAGAPAAAYSDEAWSRRVGTVSGQHVGRLRRVYEQFGQVYEQYPGLYWSHFLAALDWPDAEMWLEGAVQNGWSVGRMRAQRWETLGGPADKKPREEDIITAELDEDAQPAALEGPAADTLDMSLGVVHDPQGEAAPEGDQSPVGEALDPVPSAAPEPLAEAAGPGPLARLADWPVDLAEAAEKFQVAILNHKLSGWREVSCQQVLEVLEALKALASAPDG